MRTHLALLSAFLLLLAPLPAAISDDDCADELETKLAGYAESMHGTGPQAISKVMKAHDDGDGHINEADVVAAMKTAKVSPECHKFAGNVVQHLTAMHDHDGNGKVSHEEASRYKKKGEL
mmetsp:Transcript_16389/g.30153  ORF Transcript_16389/g.30153 Transcript_16389/m.30153 type:complete len:120 (+) Transcript_16389:77-436(+)